MDTLKSPSPITLKRKSEDVSGFEEAKRLKQDAVSPKTEQSDSTNNNYKTIDEEIGDGDDVADDSFASDSESPGNEVKEVPATEATGSRSEMFQRYQQWLLKAYGELKKTKTITLKKYDRIVRTLRGLVPTVAENSKFRFWIRTKGFCLGPPDSAGDQDLFVTSLKANGETAYKRVAVVEKFFDIIYSIHVELEGRGGRHAGQKRTYRAITESYAFLPREAVTKFLLGCVECQRRSDGDLSLSDKSKTPSTPRHTPTPDTQFPCDQTVPSSSSSANPGSEPSPGTSQDPSADTGPDSDTHRHSSDDSRTTCSIQDPVETVAISSFDETPKSIPVPMNLSTIRRRIPLNLPCFESKSAEKSLSIIKKSGFPGVSPDSSSVDTKTRLSTSTPDSSHGRSVLSCSDSTISKSTDSSNTDISPIEPEHFTKPYPKKLYTIHPKTFETIQIPLNHTEISIYYERNRPYIKPKRKVESDWPLDNEERPILSTYLQYMRSLGYSDEEALKLDPEAVSLSSLIIL